ncbi:hypothetical protein IQ244_30615 [Nostoc sp. LEGE 06077]|uniref:hypothetical protein n=1 Tax=Nostoc sp. LEGE 06077 TaxID=915325 RepID=UPI00187E96E6|nr:hypothetical protein [Nostoc sp. LEGE 06077]MBE9210779.1 hypothetical protein [Nostoc sp. LEGE 06077]
MSKQARRKNRFLLGSGSTITLLLILDSAVVAAKQQQQNQLTKLIRYSPNKPEFSGSRRGAESKQKLLPVSDT